MSSNFYTILYTYTSIADIQEQYEQTTVASCLVTLGKYIYKLNYYSFLLQWIATKSLLQGRPTLHSQVQAVRGLDF